MDIKQKADDARKKAYQKVIATKLLDGIDQLSGRASSKRRWIWELLQNAKDVANEQVRTTSTLTKDYVEFKHNGNPFSIENITYLIEQVSSKNRTTETNEVPKTTGKFGTGFMTTHLLSRKVEVSGILQDVEEDSFNYKRFNILLDRSATDLEEMIQKVNAAFSIFEEIDNDDLYPLLVNYQQNQEFDTSFRYILDDANLLTAEAGIQDLQNAISYALAFIPTIQSLTVTDYINDSMYVYQTLHRHQIGKISIVTIEKETTDSLCETQIIACLSNDNQTITIAIELEALGECLYSIKETANEIPTLFCEFPLVGSESFLYPVVINSPLFNPTEPRDGIWLNLENEHKTPLNKMILEEATSLYGDLLNQVTSDWQNVHLLGKLKSKAKLPENIDTNWYIENISNQIVAKLTAAQVVDTVSGNRICLSEALIPNCKLKRDVEQFAQLASSIHGNRLPKPDHVLDWYDILKSDFGKEFLPENRYALEDLLQDVAEQETIGQLAARLSKSDPDTLAWINQIIAFTSKESEKFLDSYAVIPNQYDRFKKKKELYQDLGIPEALKDILIIFDLDWRENLVHKDITYQLSNVLDIHKATDEINKLIRKKEHLSLRVAVYNLVSCFPIDAIYAQDSKLVSIRNLIWNFARNLDNTVPDQIALEAWTAILWQEADLWLMETLVKDIEELGNVENLTIKLNLTTEDSISWLDRFIKFLGEQNQVKLYTKRAIFPNQEGIFKKEEELYIDKNIPDELKDVLEDFGCGYRGKLLNRGIQGLDTNRNQFTVKDVSDIIEKFIKDLDEKAGYKFRVPIYNLISYFRDFEPNDSTKLALWQFANRFYLGEIPPIKLLPNLQHFSWDACNTLLLKSMLAKITSLKNLEEFVKYFNSEHNKAIEWLDKFSFFVANLDEQFLNKYIFLPNQSSLFMHKKDLKKDGGIPEELKVVCEILTSNQWNDFLLHKSLIKIEELFETEETKTIEDIATEIDRSIQQWERNGKAGDSRFIEVITRMLEWSDNQRDEREIERLFIYFYNNRAQLLLKTLNDNNVSGEVFAILSHREKLPTLVKLAENPDLSEKDLADFAENPEQFKEFQVLRGQISSQDLKEIIDNQQEFQAFRILTEEVSFKEISELVQNKDKFDALKHLSKLLQDFTDSGATSELIIALQEFGVYETVAPIFLSPSIGQVLDMPEITIDQDDMAAIGRKGEEFVYQKLVKKFGEERVRWLNKDCEQFGPYDFVVTGKIKWFGGFNNQTGQINDYGFVECERKDDIWVHRTDIYCSESDLKEGTLVKFELIIHNKRYRAMNLHLLNLSEEKDLDIIKCCFNNSDPKLSALALSGYLKNNLIEEAISLADQKLRIFLPWQKKRFLDYVPETILMHYNAQSIRQLLPYNKQLNLCLKLFPDDLSIEIDAALRKDIFKLILNIQNENQEISKESISKVYKLYVDSPEDRKCLNIKFHVECLVELISNIESTSSRDILLSELRELLVHSKLDTSFPRIPDDIILEQQIWSIASRDRRIAILVNQISNHQDLNYQDNIVKIAEILEGSPKEDITKLVSIFRDNEFIKSHNVILKFLPAIEQITLLTARLKNNVSENAKTISQIAKILAITSSDKLQLLLSRLPDSVKKCDEILEFLSGEEKILVLLSKLEEECQSENQDLVQKIGNVINAVSNDERIILIYLLPEWLRYKEEILKLFHFLLPEDQIKLLWSSIADGSLSNWHYLSRQAKILCIYRLTKENKNISIFLNEFKNLQTTSPENDNLVRCVLKILWAKEHPERRNEVFQQVHDLLIQYVIENAKNSTEPLNLDPLLPYCQPTEVRVKYCEGRLWVNTNNQATEATTLVSQACCPRARQRPCDLFDPKSRVNLRRSLYGARLYAECSQDWEKWSLLELFQVAGIEPSLPDLRRPEDYLTKLSGWINRINEIRVRLKCSVCGDIMPHNIEYAKFLAKFRVTVFSCKYGRDHDYKIYLNECWGCGEIIDSRESKYQSPEDNYYLCIHCGSGTQDSDSYTQGDICPKCGTLGMELSQYNNRYRECCSCNYSIKLPDERKITGIKCPQCKTRGMILTVNQKNEQVRLCRSHSCGYSVNQKVFLQRGSARTPVAFDTF